MESKFETDGVLFLFEFEINFLEKLKNENKEKLLILLTLSILSVLFNEIIR